MPSLRASPVPQPVPHTWSIDDRKAHLTALAVAGMQDPEVVAAANAARARSDGTPRGIAAEVLRTAQRAGYVADPGGEEYHPPSVAYTLRYGGACHALAALLLALAWRAGIPASLARIDQPAAPQDHMSAKLYVNDRWVWAEPSLRCAQLGEHPYVALPRCPIGSQPVSFDGVFAL